MNFRVKIRLNRLPDFCHITFPGPHRLACTPHGLGLWKYHIWVISVSNFKLQIAFLLSILINFPVRLIMSGVLVFLYGVIEWTNFVNCVDYRPTMLIFERRCYTAKQRRRFLCREKWDSASCLRKWSWATLPITMSAIHLKARCKMDRAGHWKINKRYHIPYG